MPNTPTYADLSNWVSDSSRVAALRASVPMESAEVFDGKSLIRPAVYAGWKKGESVFEIIPMNQDGNQILVITVASRERQAKMMCSQMRALRDEGLGLPAILGYGWIGGKRSEGSGELAEVIDSFDAPNRVSDIIWGESNLIDDQSWTPDAGTAPKASTPWLDSGIGKKLALSGDISPLDLLEIYPAASLFGFDPRASVVKMKSDKEGGKEGGKQTKDDSVRVGKPIVARPRGRVCQAAIRGILSSATGNASAAREVKNWGHLGTRTSRLHPSSNFSATKDGHIEGTPGKGLPPSKVGLGNLPFSGNLDVVPVEGIRMDMSVSLSALRCDDYGDDTLNRSARALLTALAVRCMTKLAEGEPVRTACTLTGPTVVRWEMIGAGHSDTFELDLETADLLLLEAIDNFGKWDGATHKVWVNDSVSNWLTRDHCKIIEPEVDTKSTES